VSPLSSAAAPAANRRSFSALRAGACRRWVAAGWAAQCAGRQIKLAAAIKHPVMIDFVMLMESIALNAEQGYSYAGQIECNDKAVRKEFE
jgi:hypothetical protein